MLGQGAGRPLRFTLSVCSPPPPREGASRLTGWMEPAHHQVAPRDHGPSGLVGARAPPSVAPRKCRGWVSTWARYSHPGLRPGPPSFCFHRRKRVLGAENWPRGGQPWVHTGHTRVPGSPAKSLSSCGQQTLLNHGQDEGASPGLTTPELGGVIRPPLPIAFKPLPPPKPLCAVNSRANPQKREANSTLAASPQLGALSQVGPGRGPGGTWKDLMNVHSSVRMPSPRLSSLTRRMTRKRRKKVMEMREFSSAFWGR